MRPGGSDAPEGIGSSWLTPGRFAILLGALLFAAFPRVMAGLDSFYYRDYGVLGYPFVFHHHESFWRGELPLWNPLSNCGAPFLAQWGTMVLYPPSLVYLVFPLPWSLSYFCLGHLFLAGLGMYFLAQRWTGSRFPASVAGLAFVFNGVTLSCLLWPNYTVALGWMPWVILAVEQGWEKGGKSLLLATLPASLQMLSGVPEVVLLTWLVLGTIWIPALVRNRCARRQIAIRFVLVIAVVAGLTAVQLLPFFDLLAHSQRDATFVTSKWAMPSWGLANLLVPLFHSFETFQGPFFVHGQEFMSSYYLGLAVLLCGVWGTFQVRAPRFWILAGLTVFSVFMAMGENGFLFPWLKHMIPVMGIARFPIKFVILAAFAFPLLAAYGLRQFEQAPRSRTLQGSWVAVSTAALLSIAIIVWMAKLHPLPLDQWPATLRNGASRGLLTLGFAGLLLAIHRVVREPWRMMLQLGWLALIAADALTHTPKQNPTLPVSAFEDHLWPKHQELSAPRWGESRVLISQEAERHLLRSRVGQPLFDFMGKRLALWSNLNLLEDIPKVNGSSTLQIREEKQVEKLLESDTNQVAQGLMDFLAVSRVTKPGTVVEWSARSNASPLITVGAKPIFASAEATLAALISPSFNPRGEVYLPRESQPSVSATGQARATLLSQRFRAGQIECEVESDGPAMIVIAQSFYEAWKPRIDGQPVPLLRANHAFQAIQTSPGRHRLLLTYDDRSFWRGLTISGLSLVGCAAGWAFQSRRARVLS